MATRKLSPNMLAALRIAATRAGALRPGQHDAAFVRGPTILALAARGLIHTCGFGWEVTDAGRATLAGANALMENA